MIHHQTWHTHTKFKLGVFFFATLLHIRPTIFDDLIANNLKKIPQEIEEDCFVKKESLRLVDSRILPPTDHKISSLSHYKSTKKSLNAMTHAYRLFKTTFAAALSSLAPLPHTIDHCCHYFTTKEENSMMSPFRRLTTLQYYDNDYAM